MSVEYKTADSLSDTYVAPGAISQISKPWITILAIVASLGTFIGLAIKNDYESWTTLALFGYLPAEEIRTGSYWALITSTFVHFAAWHVALNVYWLWVLGSRMERAVGGRVYLAFFLCSAFVSSASQLATSETTGTGASGVVYAIFGFMWPTRRKYPSFAEILDWRTIQLFLIWMGGCIVAEYLKVAHIGNAAHVFGFLFGATVARGFALPFMPKLFRSAAAILLVAGAVPLFWCPWSVSWLSTAAYEAHVAEKYEEAIGRYTQIIRIDPDNSWAYLNRSYAFEALGDNAKAQTDIQHAREIESEIENLP